MFKNCLTHLSMKLEGYSFLIRVVLTDWNAESFSANFIVCNKIANKLPTVPFAKCRRAKPMIAKK